MVNGKTTDENFSASLTGGEREAITLEIVSGKADVMAMILE